jgi:prepilin-type N-terminal cleavage/methylation domain-containing protein/prepilin-type processing-associated H-X9-DG protein
MRTKRDIAGARRGGFTMVELLVVVAIVSALAGIGFAVGGPMIAKSRQTACLNQLRSIGVGLQGYLQDNNQMMPEMEAGRSLKSMDVPVMDTVLGPYVENPDVFRCPEDKVEFAKSGSSYLWNHTQNGRHVTNLSFFGIEDRPEKIPLVSDKEAWHPDGTNFLYADFSGSSQIRFTTGP